MTEDNAIGYDLAEFCQNITDAPNGYDFGNIAKNLTVARGLSKLQRQIMLLALRNRNAPRDKLTYTRHAEILHECFGWEKRNHWLINHLDVRDSYGHVFSAAKKGQAYNSAHTSVSRATRRLEERGLVTRISGYSRWAGIELTELGMTVAEVLAKSAVQSSDKIAGLTSS